MFLANTAFLNNALFFYVGDTYALVRTVSYLVRGKVSSPRETKVLSLLNLATTFLLVSLFFLMHVPDCSAVIKTPAPLSLPKKAKLYGDDLLIRICGCKQADRIIILVPVLHKDGIPCAFYSYIFTINVPDAIGKLTCVPEVFCSFLSVCNSGF